MTENSALLVLLSALLHAVWNAIVKHEKDPKSAGLAVLAVAAVTAAALTPWIRSAAFPSASGLLWALGAGLFEGIYFVALGTALARGPLGPVYTVSRGGAMLVTWPLSVFFLGEPFTWAAGIGVLLVGTGLGLTAWRPSEHATPAALRWAAGCAASIAGYHLCYKLALSARAQPYALFAVALACALPINVASMGRTAVRRGWLAARRSPLRICIGGVTCTASFVIFLQALVVTGAGAVLTLRNTSVLFTQILALWGGEKPSKRVMGGAVLVVGGALLLTRS
jgi:drug/metabolite transporter (DMT)-like permease